MPAGFLCRETLSDRWMRIHSLPASKRYPENDTERAEVLRRHNTVATATLGNNAHCILFIAHFSDSPNNIAPNDYFPENLSFAHIFTLDSNEEHDDIQLFAAEIHWTQGAFDSVILARAEDEIPPILFANLDRRTAYAPYDGGADLILTSSDAIASAKRIWSQWLSFREDGL